MWKWQKLGGLWKLETLGSGIQEENVEIFSKDMFGEAMVVGGDKGAGEEIMHGLGPVPWS
jgi:hypothetical protein